MGDFHNLGHAEGRAADVAPDLPVAHERAQDGGGNSPGEEEGADPVEHPVYRLTEQIAGIVGIGLPSIK